MRIEAPDLACSSYATLWQVRSPLSQNKRPGASSRLTSRMEATWELSSGQQLLRGSSADAGDAAAQLQRALRFVQSGISVTGEPVCFIRFSSGLGFRVNRKLPPRPATQMLKRTSRCKCCCPFVQSDAFSTFEATYIQICNWYGYMPDAIR